MDQRSMRLVTVKRLEMAERSMTTRLWMAKMTGTAIDDWKNKIEASITEVETIKDMAVTMTGARNGTTEVTIIAVIMSEATVDDTAGRNRFFSYVNTHVDLVATPKCRSACSCKMYRYQSTGFPAQ